MVLEDGFNRHRMTRADLTIAEYPTVAVLLLSHHVTTAYALHLLTQHPRRWATSSRTACLTAQASSTFGKLGLADDPSTNRRVLAVLRFPQD